MDMTFEKEFPNLKAQKHTNCNIMYSDGTSDYMDECEVFYKDQIQEHCLDKQKVKDYLDEEINYLENHVKTANEGIKINVERVESWIFEAKKIKKELWFK